MKYDKGQRRTRPLSEYPEDKFLHLAKEVKKVVDDKAKFTDWSQHDDIKAELKVDLIILPLSGKRLPAGGSG